MKELWGHVVSGTGTRGQAFLAAALALAAGLAVAGLLLRPLLRLLLSREPDRDRDALRRRRMNMFVLTAVAMAVYVYFRTGMPPAARVTALRAQLAELAFFSLAGTGAVELVLLAFGQYLPQLRRRPPLAPILMDLSRVGLVVAVFFLGVRQVFPTADIGALITTSAILSIVLGLALQESLSNVFGGIMLTVDRPFKPGDWIDVDGQEGKVLDSNWRSTRVLTRDDDVIYVPNSTLAKSNVTNYSAPDPDKMVRRKIGVDYAAPPNKVRAVLIELMKGVEGVLSKPVPDVLVLDYADFAVLYEMRFWITDYDRREHIEAEVMRLVWYHFKREGINIPFPVRDVYLRREKPAVRPEETLALLRTVDILKPLSDDDLLLLAGDLAHALFARGERICVQGEPGSTFYLVKSGSVAVAVRGEDGVETELARLGPGQHFGEMSLLTGETRSSTCSAAEDCELLCLDRESFEVLLRKNPALAQAMSEILAARALATREKLAKERETLVLRRRPETESGAARILEKIRTIFRFKS